jgi:dihydroorotate dehydrogenase
MKVTLAQQVAAVAREIAHAAQRLSEAGSPSGKMKQEEAEHQIAAMNAVIDTLKDYQAMQPKVLAISSVCLTLGQRLGMDQPALDKLLERAELTAKDELEKAPKVAAP